MSRVGLTPRVRGAGRVGGRSTQGRCRGRWVRIPSKPVRTPSSGHGLKTTSAFPSGLIPDGNAEGTGVR